MENQSYIDLSIIIPTLNEARNIGRLIDKLTPLYPKASILVVDDDSVDGTKKIVLDKRKENKNINLLDRKGKKFKGITASVVDGISLVNTEYFVVIDGDLQHPPSIIKEMYNYLNEDYQLIAGARLPYQENQGLHRIIVTRLATYAAKIFLRLKGINIKDPMSGLFLSKTKLINDLILEYPNGFEPEGYKVLFDILKKIDSKTKIKNINYQFEFRTHGKSKLKPKHAFLFIRSLFK